MDELIRAIIRENKQRRKEYFAPFNPITGEGSIGQRATFTCCDFPIPTQHLPMEMLDEPFVKQLKKAGSVEALIRDVLQMPVTAEAIEKVVEQFTRIRFVHDFAFWAATLVYIKRKGGGTDVLFKLNRAQRKLIAKLEKMRKAGKPIRLILLKARQWGGSTAIQLYMAWLQLIHKVGLNSLIIAHQGTGSDEIKDMFDRAIKAYPVEMLHELGEAYAPNEPKMVGVGKSGNIFRVPQRNCKIKIGTAERPNSCRGGDYNLVHLSEVALWKETDGKKPEDIVRSACSGILLQEYTMIVYESTPNGVGNFFHREYLAAKHGLSQFMALFIAWFEIEQYELPFASDAERYAFAKKLYENRNNDEVKSDRIARTDNVLYLDFELSDKQFQLRYTNEHGNLYTFPERLYRVSLDCNSLLEENFEEAIIGSIEQMALQTASKIFIVDNLTYLCCAMEKGDAAGRLMIQLNNLKKRYELSILVLAHTPKRSLDCPITSNDLAGSKRLYNFFDSVFAIGKSAQDGGLRYVKQLKVRYGTYSYDADNVIIYEIEKVDAFLQFVHRGYSTEKEHLKKLGDNESSQRNCLILQLSQSGRSVREIASQVNCGKSTVSRIIQRSKDGDKTAVPSVPPSQPTASGTTGQDGTVGTIKEVMQAELFTGNDNTEDKL